MQTPSALLTDFYQLSMASGYWRLGIHDQQAVFYLFFRRNPKRGDYVAVSGLQSVIDFIEQFQFTDEDIEYLKSLKNPAFSDDFLQYLKTLRFTGSIDAMPEGSIAFPNEPVLRIQAPLILCQLLETPLINLINFASTVTTLASRMRTIAGDKASLLEFGLRRAQGPNGALTASRAAYIGGFDATSNMMAGHAFNIPVVGTMSHSWVMAFQSEIEAFEHYADVMSDNVILLVDTYDTALGVDHVITLGKKLKEKSIALKGIRLDSGDLTVLSKMAREKLDRAGFLETKIYVSGDITEERLMDLKNAQSPIDGWGVGTSLSTAYDQPALDMVYKLSAIQHEPNKWEYKLKKSENQAKTSDPGILQVKRFFKDQKWLRDVIYLEEQGVSDALIHPTEESQCLLLPIFKNGKCVYQNPSLMHSREFCMNQVKQFHASKEAGYSVLRDPKLLSLKKILTDAIDHEK